jgi:hypothetical protein
MTVAGRRRRPSSAAAIIRPMNGSYLSFERAVATATGTAMTTS